MSNCKACIKSKQIKDGKIKPKDLNNGAKPGQAASSAKGGLFGTTTTTPTAVRQVTLNLPGPGAVIATGHVTMSSAINGVLCKIDTAVTAINTNTDVFGALRLQTPSDFGTLSTQRVFTAAAGSFTAFLICTGNAPAGESIFAPILSLVFVPGAQTITQESASADGPSSSSAKFGK